MKFWFIALACLLMMTGCEHNGNDKGSMYGGDQAVQKSDGSKVETIVASDGTRTEVRTFPSGEVTRVTRTTRPGSRPEVRVEFRDGRTAKLEEESDIEQAMEATGDAIASAARKTWEVSKEVGEEIGDKAEDVADQTVDTSKKVGKKIGKGAKKVGGKIKDAVD